MAKADEIKARITAASSPLRRQPSQPPEVPDHQLVRCIGEGSYGEVWLARSAVGTWRAVKVVHRERFKDPRPYEREFNGIQKYEPVSRANDGLVDVLQIGRNDEKGYFYYVMELADNAGGGESAAASDKREDPSDWAPFNPSQGFIQQTVRLSSETGGAPAPFDPSAYVPRTLATDIRACGRLPLDDCITLGLTLSLALGHLHRRGLIHRDVKPSNIIFVNGVPKLADIGLVTDVAEARSFVGTEGFIPPEGPNSPQADMYGLGKVLYEASMGKDRQEFPKPCSGLGLDADSRALMELNAVLLKACATDPKERYFSDEQMNADLALLHSGQSIRDKHALERRLRGTRRLATATLAILLLGVVPYYFAIREARLATTAANRAEAGEKKAQVEAGKSREVARLLEEMIQGVGPSVALGRDTVLLKEILDKTTRRLGTGLNDQPEVNAELRSTIGRVFQALGQYEEAEAMYRQALELRVALFGLESAPSAESQHELAVDLTSNGMLAEAERLELLSLKTRRKLFGQDSPEVTASLAGFGSILKVEGRLPEAEAVFRQVLVFRKTHLKDGDTSLTSTLNDLGGVLRARGNQAEAEKIYREALAFEKKSLDTAEPAIAATLSDLAGVLMEEDETGTRARITEAEALLREAFATSRKVAGNAHPLVERTLNSLVTLLSKQGRLQEAEVLRREDLEAALKDLGADHPTVALKRGSLAGLLRAQGRTDEALALEDTSITLARKLSRIEPAKGQAILAHLAAILRQLNVPSQAEPLLREALASARLTADSEPSRLEKRLMELADCLRSENKFSEAETLLNEALAKSTKLANNGDELARLESLEFAKFALMRQENKLAEAETVGREAIALQRQRVGQDAPDVAASLVGLASVLKDEDKKSEAEKTFRESAEIAKKTCGNDHPEDVALPLCGVGWVLQSEQRLSEAENFARRALSLRQQLKAGRARNALLADSFYQLGSVLWNEGQLAEAEKQTREGLRLYQLNDPKDWQVFKSMTMLGGILNSENQHAEAEEVLRQAIALARRLPSAEHPADLAQTLCDLAWVLQTEEKLDEAEADTLEALALRKKLDPANLLSRTVADSLYELAVVLQSEGKARQAEVPARECLAVYEKTMPGQWLTYNCRSTLGNILTSQQKYSEAEPLLLSAYEGLNQMRGVLPFDMKMRVREALQRLILLYDKMPNSERASTWKRKLAELNAEQ